MYNNIGIWQSALSAPSRDAKRLDFDLNENYPLAESQDGATYLSLPLEVIPTDMPLPCALYVRISEKFVLFRKAGDVLTSERSQSLVGPSNGMLFVSLTDWNRLLHSLEAVLIVTDQALTPENALNQGLKIRHLLVAYAIEIERHKSFTHETLDRIQILAHQLAAVLYQNAELSKLLLTRSQEPELYYINHAANVAVYAIAVAKKQNLPLENVKTLALAALVHNIGNTLVPAHLLYKPGELTPEEKQVLDTHILHGASLLQSLGAPKEAVLTAMQHHDRYDGQGQADRKGGEEIHLFARICSIADVFDALTSVRPYYTTPLTPVAAVQRMLEMKGKFDPKILPMVTD